MVHEMNSTCPICNQTFQLKSYLKKHIATVHEGQKPYKCPQCDMNFSQKGGLKSHIDHIHEGKKYKHQCPQCDVSSHSPKLLQQHIAVVHEGKKPFQCSLCEVSCQSKGGLQVIFYQSAFISSSIKPKLTNDCSLKKKSQIVLK